jgi:tRNA G46 methylase TrmB|tara:strand:- start:1367 stop:1582 length:216 start_codon:yes stop_codon:yes gene_type:complete
MSEKIFKAQCAIVFKTSNRSNARTKIKTYKKKSVDEILSAKKLVGVPDNAIILEIGFGTVFEQQYRKKYKL